MLKLKREKLLKMNKNFTKKISFTLKINSSPLLY